MRAPKIKQNRASEYALQQQTEAGPALREGGKQTLQDILLTVPILRVVGRDGNVTKEDLRIILLRDAQFDNPTL